MEPLRNRQQIPAPQDEGPAMEGRGGDEARLQTQAPAEIHRPGLFGDEGVGPAFQQISLLPCGVDDSPQAPARFQQIQADGLVQPRGSLQQPMSRGQPGDSSSNHNQPVRRP